MKKTILADELKVGDRLVTDYGVETIRHIQHRLSYLPEHLEVSTDKADMLYKKHDDVQIEVE